MKRALVEREWLERGHAAGTGALCTGTVTLYNLCREPGGRTIAPQRWQRTVLRGVQYTERLQSATTEQGLKMTVSVSLMVPVDVDADGRHYLPPEDFQRCENKELYWTLDAENGQDVVVCGICEAELGEAYPLAALKKEHGFVTVRAVRDNTLRRRLKHWKAGCV